MERISKIIYINLDRRTDRNQEMLDEFKKMNITNFERFSAIPTCPGTIGCGQSHIRVLQIAQQRQYDNILILEDDFTFLVTREQLDQCLHHIFEEFQEPWDVIMFGYDLSETKDGGDHCLGRLTKAQTALDTLSIDIIIKPCSIT